MIGKTTSWVDDIIRATAITIVADEGTVVNKTGRHIVYTCPAGKLTIGYGRNVEDFGLSEDEAQYLLNNDVKRVFYRLMDSFRWFVDLDHPRQIILINMCFQLGFTRFLKFKKMLAAIEAKDYKTAAKEMKDSIWFTQTPQRVERLAKAMASGDYIKGV